MQSIYQYLDYQKFLEQRMEDLKKVDASVSLRSVAKAAGFSSAGYIRYVLQGERRLKEESAKKVAKGFRLNPQETRYFCDLVEYANSQNPIEKQKVYEKLLANKNYQQWHPLEKEQFQYYSNWYVPVVREIIGAGAFREDYEWLARQLKPAISESDAKHAVATLISLGLIKRSSEGRLEPAVEVVTTGKGISSVHAVSAYHREMIRLGAESIDRFASKERDITSATLELPVSELEDIRRRIADFRRELLDRYKAKKASSNSQVFQLNIQFFPVSEALEEVES